jgi:hypothetical protein
MLGSLAELYARGLRVAWSNVFHEETERVALPHYPWQRERHWFVSTDRETSSFRRVGTKTGHPLLGLRQRSVRPAWETDLSEGRDVFDGRYAAGPFLGLERPPRALAPDVRIDPGAVVEGPCFLDEGVVVRAGARVGPYSVVGRQTVIEEDAQIEAAIVWPNGRIGREATVRDVILGRNCHVGRNVAVAPGAVLGDKTTLTDYSRV